MIAQTDEVGIVKNHKSSENQISESFGIPLPQPIPTFRQLLINTTHRYSHNVALISMHQQPDVVPIQFPRQLDLTLRHDYTSDQIPNGKDNLKDTNRQSRCLRWTHGQLQYAAESLALAFRARGVQKGQPIATFLFNGVEWAILFRTAALLGCPFVPLNPRGLGNVKETEHMLKMSGAAVVVVQNSEMVEKLEQSLPDMVNNMTLRIVLGESASSTSPTWSNFYHSFGDPGLQNGYPLTSLAVEGSPETDDDIALIIFTSGTTSLPKGAIYTNTTLSSNLLSAGMAMKLTESSRTCCHLPTHHIGGVQMAMTFMMVGGSTIFPSATFNPAASLDAISQEKCTNFPCVPAMLQALAAQPNYKTTDTSSLRNVETGATTILLEHFRLAHKVLRCKSISNGYAASECAPVTLQFFDAATADRVTVGTATPGVKIRICAPDSRIPLARGEAGEVHVSGPQAIKGYLGGASSDSFYEDKLGRWFLTGDQGIMEEDGNMSISGRYKDIIIRGGENIAPAAIEAVLDAKLGITAQVVGVPSEEAGEVPVAVIQPKQGQVIVNTEIRVAIGKVLGSAFVPERFYTLEDLSLKDYPRTSSGKVRKVELKALLVAHEAALEQSESRADAITDSAASEGKLVQLWHKTIGIDVNLLGPSSNIQDLADSLTLMRLRNLIKREMGLDVSISELLEAGTLAKQTALLSARQKSSSPTSATLYVPREGPPTAADIAITLGSADIAATIQKQVTEAIAPFGFTWDEDVEDVLPSWDLGYEVFGSVAGTAKVNHRMSLSAKKASVAELRTALCRAIACHSMQRSFELRGVNDEPTMRVIMRPNERWFRYSIEEIPQVDHPDELEKLLYDNKHFSEVEAPYPSFQVRIAHIKSTNTAGLIWALQHSAFDGLAMYTFLEDLDAALLDSSAALKPHIPYKLWADMYYLHRSSLSAKRSVAQQVRRLSRLPSHAASLFPPLPTSSPASSTSLTEVTQRKTFLAPILFASLPHLTDLRADHSISPFILMKAALAIFLARKTRTGVALFSQNDNGRSWPFVEPWLQNMLPDCMDLAGPTLERTVQIVEVPQGSTTTTVLDFLLQLKKRQDIETHDVHAPWNLVREGLKDITGGTAMFDTVAMSTCLNYLPVRTQDGKVVFEAIKYHETKANCETAWLFNCGVEGEGRDTKVWTQILADEDMVTRKDAVGWAEEVLDIAAWIGDKENWSESLDTCKLSL